MKTFSCQYSDEATLKQFIQKHQLQTYKHLLVQAFVKDDDRKWIQQVQKAIKKLLPNSQLIGCTCSESIHLGERIVNQNILTFTAFEQTKIQTFVLEESELNNIEEINRSITSDLSAYFLFTTGEYAKLESLHQYLSIQKKISGVGAVVHSNWAHSNVLFSIDRIIHGAIIVFFYNTNLTVTTYTDRWEESSYRFRITQSEGNRVMEIDGENPLLRFRKHFKQLFASNINLDPSSLPFLLTRRKGKDLSRILRFFHDGTFELSTTPIQREEYALVHPDDYQSILRLEHFMENPIESIFVFTSTWQQDVYPLQTKEKLKHLQNTAPTFGILSNVHFLSKEDRFLRQMYSFQAIGLSETPIKQKKEPFRWQSGERNLLLYYRDLLSINEQSFKRLKERYFTVNEYFNSLFEHNDDFVFSVDLYGRFTRVNQTFLSTFGIKEEEIIGKSVLNYVKKEDLRQVKRYFIKSLKGYEQSYQITLPFTGNQIFQIRNIPIFINGQPEGIIGFGRNFTEKIKFEEKIIQLAYYDRETNLPNRSLIIETITEEIDRVSAKGSGNLTLMFLDIDRFKMINDSLGHQIGDQVIKDIAYRIQWIIPEDVKIGRFGGDQFALIFPSAYDSKRILTIGQQLLDEISKPFVHEGQEFFLSASAGVSVYPEDGKDTVLILKNADMAMNRAKKLGGNKITFFSNEMNNQIKQRFELENYLRRAIEKDELRLCYQPLIDLKTGAIIGSESLIRWHHPKLGLISPLNFIPIAEETGLIHEIGNWVLHEACKQNKKWIDEGIGNLSISVNVSAVQFQHPNFIDYVKNALNTSKLDPTLLHLELTESGMLFNLQHAVETMKKLQKLGVKVSIDDFGKGYSSLSYLKNLPINILKIDRSLIRHIHEKQVDRSIVQAIITMGNGLSVKIVAEGVESFEQIEELKKLDCHYAQGYYIEKPIDALTFSERIKNHRQILSNP
ncbi:EAL domain-containing protein [Fervidibacillus halotolerans]|uniref:EAL domain-containing protein n=1 Tax=Fervidibacillus halotolerans TaxID=2980027 RepID=A0A9E8M153_9BACI|nr:EAL domain-containing protein [Fervidibacillus halotolerans]WAA13042.1 EAL domain-containing protein [Fervidibacillus halotolerans]